MNFFIIKTMFWTCLLILFTGIMQLSANDKNSAVQQGITITGKVTDNSGPLPGVSIVVKGTSTGTITDHNGRYSIAVPNSDAVLVFSFVGFVTEEISVGLGRTIDVSLVESIAAIEEVVAVGYGSQKKVNLTGAVGIVSGQDIASRSSTDVVNAMMGQIPGLHVSRSGGQPGAETDGTSSMRVRGFTSVNNAQALVLIDGVEGLLHTLNAEDIESISVLKDAASAAIYGSRAAAGVILVTTKKGAVQKTNLTYNGSFGLNVPGLMPQRIEPWEDYSYIHHSIYNYLPSFVINQETIDWIKNPNFNYHLMGTRWNEVDAQNWMHLGMKEYTTQQTHSVSVTGGNDKTQYYVSGGFYSKSGILRYGPDNSNRVNFRASLNTEINKYLDFNLQASYEENQRQEVAGLGAIGVLNLLYSKSGYNGLYLPEEDTYREIDPYQSGSAANPIQIMKESGVVNRQYQYFTGFAGWRIKNLVKDLTLDLNFSRRAGYETNEGDYRFIFGHGRNGEPRPTHINNPQRVVKSKANSYHDKLEALLNYDWTISAHHVRVLSGASHERYLRDFIYGEARNGISNDFFSFNYYDNSVAANSVLGDAIQPWKMASLFGRLNYDFDSRYLFEANLRLDGSSRLSPGNRWGVFPSASVGWRISEEAFFEGAQKVDNLKIRASWGNLGNSTALSSEYYPYYDLISKNTFWSMPVYYSNAIVSKKLKWESITSTNVGVDAGFLNNRLNLTADYYWKKNKDMMARLKTGNIIGVTNLPLENVGELKVWGWELSAQWRDRIGKITYHAGFNIDDSQNKLVKYTGNNVVNEGLVQFLEGYPINTIWGYQTDGFWQSRDEYLAYKEANPGYETVAQDARISGGDVRYLTQGNADHKVGVGAGSPENPGDLIKLGTETPRFMYGANLGIEWKGFDFSTFWQGIGYRKFVVLNSVLGPMVSTGRTPLTIHRDHWREDNPDAYFARLVGNNTYNYHVTDRWLQNGAYIRLKNIQLGYTIPNPKNKIQSLRIYVTGADVWEYTKALKIFDPEVRASGGSTVSASTGNYYPFFRTWTFGVRLTI